MSYLIPIFCAYVVYIYNYKKIVEIRVEIKYLKDMNEEVFWKKLDNLSDKLSQLEIKVSKIETRIGVYSAIAVFASSIVIKFADKMF